VQLDARNFDAQQDLIQYDCTAPGMVGGGEEKAQPLIEKLMKMDAAEGHYATGICRAQKKDYAARMRNLRRRWTASRRPPTAFTTSATILFSARMRKNFWRWPRPERTWRRTIRAGNSTGA